MDDAAFTHGEEGSDTPTCRRRGAAGNSQRAATGHERCRSAAAALPVADPFQNETEAIVLARSGLSYAGFGLARS